jgi:hypothetical protein
LKILFGNPSIYLIGKYNFTGKKLLLISISILLNSCATAPTPLFFRIDERAQNPQGFYGYYEPIPAALQSKMKTYTWQSTCPVPLDQLSYIKLAYWGFDNKPHEGELIINRKYAQEILQIFKTLYDKKFPIHSMKLMEDFRGNDSASTLANNTTAFNCRAMVNNQALYSLHSYGWAIDINPRQNPFVENNTITPRGSETYADRTHIRPGMIVKNSIIYDEFMKRGWVWGGAWPHLQDYQHFEKPGKNFVKSGTPVR